MVAFANWGLGHRGNGEKKVGPCHLESDPAHTHGSWEAPREKYWYVMVNVD